MEQTYLDMFLQGGFIIYILLIISIISLAIIIERLAFIYKQNVRYDNFFSELKSAVKSNDESNKQKILNKKETVIGKFISQLKPDSSDNLSRTDRSHEAADGGGEGCNGDAVG